MNWTRKAYIFAAGELVRPSLLFWLEDHGFHRRRDIVFIHEGRDQCIAYSAGIAKALADGVEMALFADCDADPSEHATGSFLRENRYHLQCVKYATECAAAFDRHDDFHSLMWRASRASLLAIQSEAVKTGSRLCEWRTDALGTIGQECACASIARHARNAGLTTGWVGRANHVPRTSSGIPRICRYGL